MIRDICKRKKGQKSEEELKGKKRRERHCTGPFQNRLHTPVLAVNISKITFLQIYHSQEMWAVWRISIPRKKWCWGSLLFAFSLATPFMSTSSLVTSSLPARYSSWCCWCQLTSWPTLVVSSVQVSMDPTWRKCFLWTIWNSLLELCFDVKRCEDTFHNNQSQEFYRDSCRAGRKDRCWKMFIITNIVLVPMKRTFANPPNSSFISYQHFTKVTMYRTVCFLWKVLLLRFTQGEI